MLVNQLQYPCLRQLTTRHSRRHRPDLGNQAGHAAVDAGRRGTGRTVRLGSTSLGPGLLAGGCSRPRTEPPVDVPTS